MKVTVVEQDFAVAPQVTAADIATLAQEGVRTVMNNRPDGEEPGQLSAADARAESQKRGMAYVHLPIVSNAITAAEVDAFEKALKTAPRPILAHCRSGTRCYLMWALVQAKHGQDPDQLVMRAAVDGYDIRALPQLASRLGLR